MKKENSNREGLFSYTISSRDITLMFARINIERDKYYLLYKLFCCFDNPIVSCYGLFTINQIWFVSHSEYLKNLMARKEKGVLASHQIVSRL